MDLINPEKKNEKKNNNGDNKKGNRYPDTKLLVKWKDGEVTLETRAFFHRIIGKWSNGKRVDPDYMIYKKAEAQENNYRMAKAAKNDSE